MQLVARHANVRPSSHQSMAEASATMARPGMRRAVVLDDRGFFRDV
jgi:hypothetical protein